jgi:hypothetical protein
MTSILTILTYTAIIITTITARGTHIPIGTNVIILTPARLLLSIQRALFITAQEQLTCGYLITRRTIPLLPIPLKPIIAKQVAAATPPILLPLHDAVWAVTLEIFLTADPLKIVLLPIHHHQADLLQTAAPAVAQAVLPAVVAPEAAAVAHRQEDFNLL